MKQKKHLPIKRNIINFAAIAVLLVGAAVWFYPKVTQHIYRRDVKEFTKEFEVRVKEPDFRMQDLYGVLKEENERLYEEGQKELKDPFAVEYPGIDLTAYGLPDQSIGYITIPKIGESLPIYLGANEENMKKGAVHLTGTSYPIGGMHSNSVIAAHRGYYKAEMFRKIDHLAVGDEVYIRNFQEELSYRVISTEVIEPVESDKILIQKGKDMLTLFSCHPYPTNRQRYVVYCERIPEK